MTKKVAVPLPFVLLGGSTTLQYYFGSSTNFFNGKFTTKKDPDELAEFYQAEDLLRIIAVHPFFFNLFMNKVDPDTEVPQEDTALLSVDETHFNVRLFGMEVSFEIIQQEEEIDNETKTTKFMRHERFIDWVPVLADFGYKLLLWDQTWVYGFNRLEDGTVEVYHRGEKFIGPWPIRLIVFFHQYYVLWACEKYINGDAFGTEDLDKQQEELACLPLHVFKEFITQLRKEKETSLKNLTDDPTADTEAIAETTETIKKLDSLIQRNQSTISVVRRKGQGGSVAKPLSVKMLATDAETNEVLASALVPTSGIKDMAVDDAVKKVTQNPELEFKLRPSKASKRIVANAKST